MNYEVKIEIVSHVLVLDAGSLEQAKAEALEAIWSIIREARANAPLGVLVNARHGLGDAAVVASAPVDNPDQSKFNLTIQ